MKVSICTITYNRHDFLKILEDSVLSQEYPHELIEWIVVDDSDPVFDDYCFKSEKLIAIVYKRLKKRTPLGKKRNIANKLANGEIIINMDDDDSYPNTRVNHSVEKLKSSRCLIAGCNTQATYFLDNGELWVTTIPHPWHSIASSFAYKKKLLEVTSYCDNDWIGEEKYFLKNYSIELLQLEPSKTILSIAHSTNTFNKDHIRKAPKEFSAKKLFLNKDQKSAINARVSRYQQISKIRDSIGESLI